MCKVLLCMTSAVKHRTQGYGTGGVGQKRFVNRVFLNVLGFPYVLMCIHLEFRWVGMGKLCM